MTALLSPTQFAWQCIGAPPWPPPEGASADDPFCWLCGGPTGGSGWLRDEALSDKFTNHNLARCQPSRTLCQACVYLGTKEGWEHYRSTRPDLALGSGHAVSWRNYSHLFAPGHHEVVSRPRARELLLDPPEPPFLLVLATSYKKHLLFRGRVALSRDRFPVQLEDDSLVVDRSAFASCLALTEQFLALGFTREEVETGRYDQHRIRRAGLATWRALEDRCRPFRLGRPELLRLAVHVASDPRKEGS